MLTDEQAWEIFHRYMVNEGLTRNRIAKHQYFFNLYKHLLRKPVMTATKDDLQQITVGLADNTLRGISGKELAGWTKSDLKKHIKKFYRIVINNGEYDPELTRWIKTRIPKDEKSNEKEIMGQDDALKICAAFKKPYFKLLILVAFDSGFRIEELLTMRRDDLLWRKTEGADSCFWVHCNTSKTKTRTIDISLFTTQIRELLDTTTYQSLKDSDKLFPVSYDSFRIHLKKRCQKILGKHITPHSFRHSSATLYAGLLEGNLIALCDRYGWEYDSPQPRIYIRRSGVNQRYSAKKVYQSQVADLHNENETLKKEFEKMQSEQKRLTNLLLKHLDLKKEIRPDDWDDVKGIYQNI